MLLEHEFSAPAGVSQVWPLLLDVELVAPCLPGAEVLGRAGEDSFDVAMKVSMGPMRMRYVGQIAIAETDPSARRAVMTASAKEARGQGTASATIDIRLTEEGDTTRVAVTTDIDLTGRVAQMGRGLVEQVADEMLRQFTTCLASKFDQQPAATESTTTAPTNTSSAATVPATKGLNPIALFLRSVLVRLRESAGRRKGQR